MKTRGKVLLFAIGLAIVAAAAKPITKIPVVHSMLSGVRTHIGESMTASTGPMNLLIIGNNARDATGPLSLGSAGGQADIMILAHIDPDKHEVDLISIPRDTLFAMPGWHEPIPKLKTMFTLGLQQSPQDGPKLAMQAVSKFTGMPISHYIVTDFQGFADAIDAVGGIQIDVKQALYDPEHSGADLKPGLQTLSGQQALAFVRIRQNAAGNDYRTDDFQRQQAELQMLEALKKKLLASGTNVASLQRLVGVWKKDVATDLSTEQLIGLGLETSGSSLHEVYLGSVHDSMDIVDAPLQGVNADNYLTGAYYDILDPANVTKTLRAYGSTGASTGLPPIPAPSRVPVTVYGSQDVVGELQKAGYTVTWGGPNATGQQFQIYYPPGQMPWAWAVGRTLGTANELVMPASHALSSVVVYAP